MDEIKFDSILPREIPVTLGDKVYKLRAPSAAAANKFRAAMADCVKKEGDTVSLTKPSKAVELHTGLVASSFYDPDGKPVPLTAVLEMPNEIVEALIKGCLDLCVFAKDEADLKNS